ncbi:MAG: ABC transporter ATP-binding protein [Pseudomonadota bacterium]|nr:ABC transporter ATP-binding protein [Pseudomonadota bacterium]
MALDNNIIEIKNLVKIYPTFRRGSVKDLLAARKMSPPNSEIQQLEFHRERALDDISIDIERGSRFGILGHNGSGKSTLLAVMLGILRPEKGSVRVNGRAIGLLEMGSGFHPELSGYENVLLHLSILGMRIADARKLMPSIVDFCELGTALSYPLKTYSAGMVTRLAFSVLSHVPADIFLVDEVLAVGDYAFQNKCIEFMKRFSEDGGTIVIVSQNPDYLKDICDIGLCLHEGTVRALGSMEIIARDYLRGSEQL